MVVLSSGGELAARARGWGGVHIPLPEIPMPRAGIGSVSVPPLIVLERIGLLPGASQYVADAVERYLENEGVLDASEGQHHARHVEMEKAA